MQELMQQESVLHHRLSLRCNLKIKLRRHGALIIAARVVSGDLLVFLIICFLSGMKEDLLGVRALKAPLVLVRYHSKY